MSHIALVTLVVRDYDEAIAFYRDALGFDLVEDTDRGDGSRWVVVRPRGGEADGTGLLLARAKDEAQGAAVGAQTGGRVGFFLHTEDFAADHERMRAAGVRFLEEPRHEAYGSVAVFEDLYGNRWDLLQPKPPDPGACVGLYAESSGSGAGGRVGFPYGRRLQRVQHRPDQRMALGPLAYGGEDPAGGGAALDRAHDHPGQLHPAQRGTRHQGHPRVRPGQGHDRAEVVRGVLHARDEPGELAGQDRHVVAGVARVRPDPRVLREVRHRHLGLVRQPVAHREHRVERLRVQGYAGEAAVVLGGRAPVLDGHRHVDLSVQHHRHARVALRVLDLDADAGRGAGQLGEGGGEHQADAGGERGDRDRALATPAL